MAGQCCEHCGHADDDHDLLIKMNENLNNALKDFKEIKEDHENRLRRAEQWGFIGLGLLYAYEFFFGVFSKR